MSSCSVKERRRGAGGAELRHPIVPYTYIPQCRLWNQVFFFTWEICVSHVESCCCIGVSRIYAVKSTHLGSTFLRHAARDGFRHRWKMTWLSNNSVLWLYSSMYGVHTHEMALSFHVPHVIVVCIVLCDVCMLEVLRGWTHVHVRSSSWRECCIIIPVLGEECIFIMCLCLLMRQCGTRNVWFLGGGMGKYNGMGDVMFFFVPSAHLVGHFFYTACLVGFFFWGGDRSGQAMRHHTLLTYMRVKRGAKRAGGARGACGLYIRGVRIISL